MRLRQLGVLAIVAIAPLALVACGADSKNSESSPPSPSPGDAASARFNAADVEFAQGMIPHHEQAIEMADIALDPTVNAGERVRDLATRIKAAQDPEIEQLSAWLAEWGQPVQMDTSGGHDMSTMKGMMSAEEMGALDQNRGADFDRLWTEMMIRHHAGAVEMAEIEQGSGANPAALALAAGIVQVQQKEISEMRELLTR